MLKDLTDRPRVSDKLFVRNEDILESDRSSGTALESYLHQRANNNAFYIVLGSKRGISEEFTIEFGVRIDSEDIDTMKRLMRNSCNR